jgi:hypothetical protein
LDSRAEGEKIRLVRRESTIVATAWFAVAACDPRIPDRFDGGGLEGDSCPAIYTSTVTPLLDDRCSFERCSLTVVQHACDVSLVTSGCSLGRLDGKIDPGGHVTLISVDGQSQCSGERSPGAIPLSLECSRERERCPIDVFAGSAAPPVVISAKAVFDASSIPGSFSMPLGAQRARSGFLFGEAIVGTRIAIGTFNGRFDRFDCDDPSPTSLVFLDRESMEITATATTPSCLTQIARDPLGGGVLGPFGAASARVGRFDTEGRLVDSVAVPLAAAAGEWPVGMLIFEDESRLLVAYTSGRSEPGHSHFVFFDLATLVVTASTAAPIQVRAVADLGSDLFGVSDHLSGRVLLFDRMTGLSRGELRLNDLGGVDAIDVGYVALHHRSGRTVAGTTGTTPIVQPLLIGSTMLGSARAADIDAVPWAMTDWPGDRGLMVVGLTAREPDLRAYLAFFDPLAIHFLPRSISIGSGAVRDAIEDPEGRVWMLLGWSSAVVRIAARPR